MKIIITGASRGLGKILAEGLAARGHDVGLLSRSAEILGRLCEEINARKNGKAWFSRCDLTNVGEVNSAVDSLINRMHGIDALINNAGSVIKKGIFEMSPDEWRTCVSTNADAAFYCARAVAPHLIKQGGHIINISSLSTKIPLERGCAYSASKHAMNGFAASLVHELHDRGVKVCTIYPGAFSTGPAGDNDWKMPATEILEACDFVLKSHPKAFIEELVIRPLRWPVN